MELLLFDSPVRFTATSFESRETHAPPQWLSKVSLDFIDVNKNLLNFIKTFN